MRMRRVTFSSVACLALPHFLHFVSQMALSSEKVIVDKSVFWFSLQLYSHISHFKMNTAVYYKCTQYSHNVSVNLVRF